MFVTPEEFTVEVSGELGVHEVRDATITTFGQGPLRVAWRHPSRFVTGAVYNSEGLLVPSSQRVGGLHSDHALAADPPHLPHPDGPVCHLDGTWLFGGTWFNHFGHFITETITTLWPELEVDRLVFVPFWFGREVLPWQVDLLRLLGTWQEPLVVGDRQLRVERLLVPDRSVIPNGQVRPEAVAVWQRIAATARSPEAPELVFLSRSHHHARTNQQVHTGRRVADNELALDSLMTRLGYTVVHPEELSAETQVKAVSGARVIVGVAGSGLHLSVFAPRGVTVVELGDPRRYRLPVRTQMMLCRAKEDRLAFIPFPAEGRSYDLERIADLLVSHDLVRG